MNIIDIIQIMKKWEEQQRKKLYNNRIQQAKPTLNTQGGKPKSR